MTDALRVILEIGKKRRVVAGEMDWPGLDRWRHRQLPDLPPLRRSVHGAYRVLPA